MASKLARRIKWGIQRRLLRYLLRGPIMICPICNVRSITFLPYGTNRANCQCPTCGSLERTRLFWLYLVSKKDFFETKKKVLHIAPERSLFKKFSQSPAIDYYPADKFTEGWNYPRGTENMDITSIRYPDNSFDFILCSHVLEHIVDDRKAMSELFRVLKPGGFGILQVPIDEDRETTFEDARVVDPLERTKLFGQFDHVRIYGRDYRDRLKEAGFELKIEDLYSTFSPDLRFQYGLLPKETLYLVFKH